MAKRRFAAVAIAAATAASLATAPAMAQDTSSLNQLSNSVGAVGGSVAGSLVAPIATSGFEDEKQAAGSIQLTYAIVGATLALATPALLAFGIYDFAVKQGWIKPIA